ncbi:MarR family winged helix-turn-helix transcriptional regulator [Conexibacter sp. CPCC 206217]|uniref:MarR family winged helix-turn-helix transcriptional regulator n=1 Tax=Conexibacter sp. CPCC 206217 TaxID=3064574 RepID=UPI00271618CC|nr:MarR family transcriptional regulator [Conexibacter sp. CPCC 206217]MDO8211613.1 MarR family transcriptional regulator [Conexibacter sp. CPCC 206217]
MAESQPLPFDPIAEARRHWRERWGEGPARPMAAVTSIMRAQQILLARLNELLRPHGLTFPRYETLMLLVFSSRGSLPVGKMGERLQVHRTSMTHMADRLEEAGLVTRVSHAQDRRSTLIAITEAGRELAERATQALNAAGMAMDPLAPEEQESITRLLSAIRRDEGDFAADAVTAADVGSTAEPRGERAAAGGERAVAAEPVRGSA